MKFLILAILPCLAYSQLLGAPGGLTDTQVDVNSEPIQAAINASRETIMTQFNSQHSENFVEVVKAQSQVREKQMCKLCYIGLPNMLQWFTKS